MTLFGSVLLALMIYLFVRRSLKPLGALSSATARMASGDTSVRCAYKGRHIGTPLVIAGSNFERRHRRCDQKSEHN